MNRFTIVLRTWLRKLGLTPLLARVINRLGILGGGQDYEEQFSSQMLGELRDADVVWEVGANVGLYTVQFAERVGASGKVYAFEPTPACFSDLERRCQGTANCTCLQLALGHESGSVEMLLSDDPLGATHTVLTDRQQGGSGTTIAVEMVRGDDLVDKRGLPVPSFLKVDVEGCELDVFQGMESVLENPRCRAVFCEVHFGLLAERGQPYASQEIEALLKRCGLTDQRWIDASHLRALRPAQSA